MASWSEAEDAYLREHYLTKQRRQIAADLGRTAGSLRKRCSVLGLNTKQGHRWTAAEVLRIVQWYADRERDDTLRLRDLAAELSRTIPVVSRKARKLGLTIQDRPFPADQKPAASQRTKQFIQERGHPRGALGLKHSDAAKEKMREASKAMWRDPDAKVNTEEHRQALSDRAIRSAFGAFTQGKAMYSRAKQGKRPDLDNRYFRSRWEANYARYLNLLLSRGQIVEWDYECQVFYFEKIRRGTRTYTPDFKVTYPDGHHEWHEVKGWMDARSKTRLRRMGKYFPQEHLVVIDKVWFRGAIQSGLHRLLPHWEKDGA